MRWLSLLAPLIGLPAITSPLWAQSADGLRGVVTDVAGAPLVGARVTILDGSATVLTGPSGAFVLRRSATASRVVASRFGFHTDTVEIPAGSLHIRLSPAPLEMAPVVISARRILSASRGAIGELDIQLRPRASSQELLRLAPGLVIAQHAGGGKAEQIFLRGFDADHGTDVAISVDGVPVNMVSHAHGQGYADLHFVIPELVERVEVRKGPFDVRDGDFATAGAVELHLKERVPSSLLGVRAGSFNTAHVLSVTPFGAGTGGAGGYIAAAGFYSAGPFQISQDHRRGNLFASWTFPLGRDTEMVARASSFGAAWGASGQIPQRAVESGEVHRFGALDPSEGGETYRTDAVVGLRSVAGSGPDWQVQAYLTRYLFDLFSNFTFFLNDPVAGDGIEQVDDRWLLGAEASYGRANRLFARTGQWAVGTRLRADRVDVALHHQRQRERLKRRVDAAVAQEHLSGWAEQEIALVPRARLRFGLRADLFRFEVRDRLAGTDSDLPHASGIELRGMVSPRANLEVDATDRTTLFLHGGSGFHSNDARDVILARGETVLPRAWGAEVGGRSSGDRGSFLASLWALDLESELVYVGDEGVTEPSGRSRRLGVDLEGRVRVVPCLWADADLSLSRGRFVDEPEGADHIPLAPEATATAGLSVRDLGPFEGGLRMRHIGSRSADESGAVRALGYTVWEASMGYSRGAIQLSLTVDNLFDVDWNEAQFATTSRLHHEPAGVKELHFTPGSPRNVQLGVSYRF